MEEEKYCMVHASDVCGYLLSQMGLSSKYEGFRCVMAMIEYFLKEKDRLGDVKITKEIYPDVGKRCKKSVNAVEHCIRVAIRVCWRTNPEAVCRLIGRKADRQPSNREFILRLMEQACYETEDVIHI